MSMTGKERLHAALKGEPIDRVPFAINIWQWFYANQYWNQMPEELAHIKTPIEFLKHIGADILTRWDGQIKGRAGLGDYVKFPNCDYQLTYSGEVPEYPLMTAFNTYHGGKKIHRKLTTPHGELTQTWRFSEEACADFEEDHWISDLGEQFDAAKFMVQDRTYDYEMSEYNRDLEAIGDDGVIMLEIPENPLKMLHWLMGPENAIMATIDYPDLCKELCEIHTQKALEFVRGVCARTRYEDAPVLMSGDNLDCMLMPPPHFDEFLYDHYQPISDACHQEGRLFGVHSCGNNWDVRDCIKKSRIDMMEGLTPPPLGTFPLEKARQEMGEHFIIEGGMFFQHQELKVGAKEAIDDYTKKLFEGMGDKRRFIYSSSCNTSPYTPLENIYHFRDACWEYGKMQ